MCNCETCNWYLVKYMGVESSVQEALQFAEHLEKKGYDLPPNDTAFRFHGIVDPSGIVMTSEDFCHELDAWRAERDHDQ